MKYCTLIFNFTMVLLLISNQGNATNYYICDCAVGSDPSCITGNDSNNGTSINSPWRSIAKVKSVVNSLEAGDQILFAKGGSWTDASLGNIYNFNSTSSNPIVFDSYTPTWGSTTKPILIEARTATNLFSFADGGNADHDEGYLIQNLDLRGGDSGQWGIFAYNDADHIIMNNLDISSFEIGVHCAGANTPNPGADIQNQHMHLLNSTITNCSGQGFLGGGDYLLIEGCYFENNGFAKAVFNHNLYLSNGDHVTVRNNELYQSAVINGKADGVSFVVHGMLDSLLIEGNYVHDDLGKVTGNAWGIAVDPGYATAEGFTNLIIRGNILVNMFNTCIGVASAPGAIIENNVIINEAASNLVAIAVPDRIREAIDMEMTNVTVRNNSIYLRNGNSFTTGILVGEEGNGHKIVSNIISIDNGNGFDFNLGDLNYEIVENNMMELINSASWGESQNLNSWTSSRGFDIHSQQDNPEFISLNSPDYNLSLPSNSPCIDAGHLTASSNIDFTGAERTSIPDIGAFENFDISNTNNQNNLGKRTIYCFPNPTHGQVVIKVNTSFKGTSYLLYNSIGLPILSGKFLNLDTVLELGEFADGLYILIYGENMNQMLKILKQ